MEWLAASALIALAIVLITAVGWGRSRREVERLRERASSADEARRDEQRTAAAERHDRDLILESMPDGVLLFRADGTPAFANRAIAGLLPMSPPSIETVLPLALRNAILEVRDARSARSVSVETGVPTRWLGATIVPAGDDGTLVIVRDVTEQRRSESVRRDFVANASHELKTPAATIQAAAETLRQAADDDPSAVPHFASQLEREAVRLSRIVADLLDLSRLESGSSLDDLVSLGAAAREEAQRLLDAADRAGVDIEVRADGERPVRGSQKDLTLLVRNLIDNAIRYSHEGSRVIVDVEGNGEHVILKVSDTGIGIPSRDIPRIFERFYRVDRARSRETGGTGLGLAIVKHIVENHGGRIDVASELGRGTTFRVDLPTAGVGVSA
jgi:signal transduction histidine kinase